MSESGRGATRIEEPTRAERTIARRAAEARATVPDLDLSTDVDVTAVGGQGSILARVVKASAEALREFPRANGTYRDGRFELHSRVNVAVSIGTESPTVFDADTKSVGDLAAELERLERRAREGELTPPELSGATFAIADLGAAGIARASAVLTPPHAATLATGAVRSVPIIRDGVIVPGLQITLTLVCDHRILFGETAARFLARIAELVQAP